MDSVEDQISRLSRVNSQEEDGPDVVRQLLTTSKQKLLNDHPQFHVLVIPLWHESGLMCRLSLCGLQTVNLAEFVV